MLQVTLLPKSPMEDAPHHMLITFATRWGAQFGGINSFNADFLAAVAAKFYENTRVLCVVLAATDDDRAAAKHESVELISLSIDQKDFPIALEPAAWELLELAIGQAQLIDAQIVWLGHDRITGAIANQAAKVRGGRSAVIHHMSYGRYEAFSENSQAANNKEQEQKAIFQTANIVLAVGPLLRDAANDFCLEQQVNMIIPGLAEISTVKAPNIFKAFLSGRLSTDIKKIKQPLLGVAGFSNAIRQAGQNSGLPNSLKGVSEPSLKLRGVEFENVQSEETTEAEQEINRFDEEQAGRVVNLQSLPFTTKRTELFTELATASVAMMPSWHEGFGLVAWEAIAAGVPLILSEKSGVYKFLEEHCDGMYVSLVWHLDIEGKVDDPYFSENDLAALVSKIFDIAKDPGVARSKAIRLRSALLNEFTWAACALSFGTVLGWQQPVALAPAVAALPVTVTNITILVQVITFLELPIPKQNLPLSDSTLLRAEEAVIAFDADRTPFLQKQMDWAIDPEFSLTLRLLAGPGGVGKTRLALELCQRLEVQGWHTGFLSGEFEKNNALHLASQLSKVNKPCCVVIDYAETRQQQLLALIEALLQLPLEQPIRLLLLARDGGDWWNLLEGKNIKCKDFLMRLAARGTFYLQVLHDSQSARSSAYLLALKTFASLLTVSVPTGAPDLSDQHFAHPLYVQMAALLALRGERPKSAEGLTRALLHHERRYWKNALSNLSGIASDNEEQAGLLMALATLIGGVASDHTAKPIWSKAGFDKKMLRSLFVALAPLYPGAHGLQGLRPDLIGEELTAQTIIGTSGGALLEAIFRHNHQPWIHSALTLVARVLAKRTEIVGTVERSLTRYFPNCVKAIVDVCIEVPSPLPQLSENVFLGLNHSNKYGVAVLLDPFFRYEIPELTGLEVAFRTEITSQKRKSATHGKPIEKQAFAKALGDLSIAYDRLGDIRKSLQLASQSCDVFNELSYLSDPTHKFEYGVSLSKLGKRFFNNGEIEKALELDARAFAIIGNFSSDSPDVRRRQLEARQNYSHHLHAANRLSDAVDHAKIALDLVDKNSANGLNCISQYAAYLDDVGKTDEADVVWASGKELAERLNFENAGKHRHSMASWLANFANAQEDRGELSQASVTHGRAIELFRQLFAVRPSRFGPDLAGALHNCSPCLLAQGRSDEALLAIAECRTIYVDLALLQPNLHLFGIVRSQLYKSQILAALGDANGAIIESHQALQACKGTGFGSSQTSRRPLASAHRNHALRCIDLGRTDEALAHIELALQIFSAVLQEGFGTDDEKDLENCILCKAQIKLSCPVTNTPSNLQVQFCCESVKPHAENDFFRNCVHAQTVPDKFLLLSLLKEWQQLNLQKRFSFADDSILLFAQAEHVLGPGHAPEDWREQLARYKAQRKGWMPWWMLEVARRDGYEHLLTG